MIAVSIRGLIGNRQRRSTTQLGSHPAFLQPVQQLVQDRIRERDVFGRWHPGTGERSSIVSRVLGHLWTKPDRRIEPIRVLSLRESDADKVQRSGRNKPLQKGLLATLQPHARALEADRAGANRQERLSLGARNLMG